jgi:hypothetical protein
MDLPNTNFVFVRTKQRQQVEQNCDDASKGKKNYFFIPYFTLGTTKFVLTSIIIRYTTNLNYKKRNWGWNKPS